MCGGDFLAEGNIQVFDPLTYVCAFVRFKKPPLGVVQRLMLDWVDSVQQLEGITPFYPFHPRQLSECNWTIHSIAQSKGNFQKNEVQIQYHKKA